MSRYIRERSISVSWFVASAALVLAMLRAVAVEAQESFEFQADLPAGPPADVATARIDQEVGLGRFEVLYSRESWSTLQGSGKPTDLSTAPRRGSGGNMGSSRLLVGWLNASTDFLLEGADLYAGEYRAALDFRGTALEVLLLEAESETEVGRFPLVPGATSADQLSIGFPKVEPGRALLEVRFGPFAGAAWLAIDLPGLVLEEVERLREFAGPDDGRTLWEWAFYCYRNDIHLAAALEWVNALVENAEIYWTVALQARLLAANERWPEAIRRAEHALLLASGNPQEPGVAEDVALLSQLVTGWQETPPGRRRAAESGATPG